MGHSRNKNCLAMALSLAVAWTLVELVLNALESPSAWSSGAILGQELPPRRIIPSIQLPGPEERLASAAAWASPLVVGGRKITFGDLYGIAREDVVLGHAPLENAVSANGWWQTNGLGARARSPTPEQPPDGTTRLLLFGDSYTQGSRVPQEETYAYFLQRNSPGLEVVNFGVDGYSMGQAFLRYDILKDRLEHHEVLLVLVPAADLWREINVIRYIAEGWPSYKVNPRFVVDGGELQLVPSPYTDLSEMLSENRPHISQALRTHLRTYDRFYFPDRYEPNPLLDHSITYRLLKRWRAKRKQRELKEGLFEPDSEALQTTRKIVEAMAASAQSVGAGFALTILPGPGDTDQFVRDAEYRSRWEAMSDFLCANLSTCYDLMEEFSGLSPDTLDLGYDGSHYGPSANRAIADFLRIRRRGQPPDQMIRLSGPG
jgi:hypothetical protein